jgi:hypothetical protein
MSDNVGYTTATNEAMKGSDQRRVEEAQAMLEGPNLWYQSR